jgi:purine-binding chemotaxis protein CheW
MSTTLKKKSLEILIFEVEGQRHGIASAAVREIVPMVTLMPLPHGPAMVEGVINLRGNVVPVVNVRSQFGLPSRAPRHTDHLIVASAGDRLVALRVDRALNLLRVDGANIEGFPSAQNGTCVAKLPGDLVLVHDLGTFLSDCEVGGMLSRPRSADPAVLIAGRESMAPWNNQCATEGSEP